MNKDIYKTLMKNTMKSKNLTVKKLADRLYVNPISVYKILSGTAVSLNVVKTIAKYFEMDLESFVIFRYKCGIPQSKNEKLILLDYIIKESRTITNN